MLIVINGIMTGTTRFKLTMVSRKRIEVTA